MTAAATTPAASKQDKVRVARGEISKAAVATVKRMIALLLEPDGRARRLQRPRDAWTNGYAAVDRTSAAVLDHHEHIEQADVRTDF